MKFSVLISVYKSDNPEHFEEALKSIWDEQILKPNQIVLVQDGPVGDEIVNVINNFKAILDDKLSFLELPVNLGLARALNEGLRLCKYDLVARMDSDDICFPDRFEKQIAFFSKNSNITVCGGSILEFNESYEKKITYPSTHEEIYNELKKRSPFAHMTVMYKKAAIIESGSYPTYYPEDYALWSILVNKGYKFANLNDVLVKFRLSNDMIARRGSNFFWGIVEILIFQKRNKLITNFQFFRNISMRAVTHLSPLFLRKIIYRIR